jgi:TPR repeat protein
MMLIILICSFSGAMYYHGIGGLVKDLSKSFELYNRAAELGSKEAWKNLA